MQLFFKFLPLLLMSFLFISFVALFDFSLFCRYLVTVVYVELQNSWETLQYYYLPFS